MSDKNQIIDELVQQPYLQRYQNIQKRKEKQQNDTSKPKNVKNLIPASKRLTVTYVVFGVWVGLAIFGILMDTNLYALAAYFASGLPLIIGYLWSETSRPSGSIKDVSKLVQSLASSENANPNFNPYPTPNPYSPNPDYHDNTPNNNQNSTIIIVSDDNSDRLEIHETELNTLLNSGYVNKNKGKYTFRKEQKEEIISLIDGNEMKDEGIYAEEEASI